MSEQDDDEAEEPMDYAPIGAHREATILSRLSRLGGKWGGNIYRREFWIKQVDAESIVREEFQAGSTQDLNLLRARDLLREVAQSGVEFDDARIGWVTVQIDRDVWDEIVARGGRINA